MTEPKKPPKGEDTSQSQPPEVTAMTATISNSDATLKANAAISTSKLSEDELNAKAAVILGKIMAMHPDRLRSVTSATPKEKVHGVAAQATVTKAPDYISLDDEEYRDAEGIVHGPGPMQSSNDMVPASAAPSQPDGFETKAGLVAICRRSYAPYDVYVGIKKAQSKMYYQDKENRREVRDWAIAAHREVVRQSKEGYKALDKVLSDSKAKAEMYDQDEEKRRQLKEWAASRHREVIRQSKELYQAFAKILSDKKVAFEERQEVKKMRDWDQAFPKLRVCYHLMLYPIAARLVFLTYLGHENSRRSVHSGRDVCSDPRISRPPVPYHHSLSGPHVTTNSCYGPS